MKVLTVGVGFGGSNMAMELAKVFSKTKENKTSTILLNTNKSELDVFEGENVHKFPIGNSGDGGSGMSPLVAKQLFKEHNDTKSFTKPAAEFITEEPGAFKYTSHEKVYIFVCYGMTGTGGGTGVMVNALFNRFSKLFKSRDIVTVGVPLLPHVTEGTRSMENAMLCVSEIKDAINSIGMPFILVANNEPTAGGIGSTRLRNETVNGKFSRLIHRYLTQSTKSTYITVDSSDKMNSLRLPGFHAIVNLTHDVKFDYDTDDDMVMYVCKDSHYDTLLCDIPDINHEEFEKLIDGSGLNYISRKVGYVSSKSGSIGLHGNTDISSVISYFENLYEMSRLAQIESENRKLKTNRRADDDKATGVSDDNDDLMSMFMN